MTTRPPKRRSKRAPLSAEDERLWRHVTRDVAPLEGRAAPRVSAPVQKRRPAPARPSGTGSLPSVAQPSSRPAPLDGPPNTQWARRMRRGDVAIDARLDLHGLTQREAHTRLLRFISIALAQEMRVLLIITGKGGHAQNGGREKDGGREKGVLRRNLPRWLKESGVRDKILAITPAHPRHGGAGAFYVALRRQRHLDADGGARR